MQRSYTNNYIYIYFFQALSIILGFASLFVVVPSISSNPTVYGVYSVCTSITIFLSYADLGFLGAGAKYAAECYAKEEQKEEIEIIGFTHFILLIVVLIISFVFLLLSYHPEFLIKNLSAGYEWTIASKLLLILAVFSPLTVLQRMVQMIFNIRLQDYKVQRIIILGNVLKILSVFYFFNRDRYDIVGYYLFFNIVNLLVVIINLIQTKYDIGYSFIRLIKQLKFNRSIYNRVKGLAFSSLFSTVCWIIFYEFDSIVIGRILGAEAVAVYAIGLTLLGFVRSLLGVFFSPFAARFNHIIALNTSTEFNSFFRNVIKLMFPIVVLPILSVVIMSRPVVLSWVGINYIQSIPVVIMLMLCNILAFIQYPAANMLVAKEKIHKLYIVSVLNPVIFWAGIAVSIGSLGVYSFSLFKLISFLVGGLVYLHFVLDCLGVTLWSFIKDIILPYIPSILFLCLILIPFTDVFCFDKSASYLLFNGIIIAIALVLSFIAAYFSVRELKAYVNNMLFSIMRKNKE